VDSGSVVTGVEVVNRYRWRGDPKFGQFSVVVDRRAVGVAPLGGAVRVELAPGVHSVQVRLWGWIRSSPIEVDVAPGQVVAFDADIARSTPAGRRVLNAWLQPASALVLRPQTS